MLAWLPQATCRTVFLSVCLFIPIKPMHSSLSPLKSLDSSERQPLQQPGAVISNESDVSHHLLGGRTSSAISAAAYKMRLLTCVAGDVELWEKMITLNLITPMRLTRILAPHLAKRNPGRLILSPDSSCIPNIFHEVFKAFWLVGASCLVLLFY